LDHIGKSAFEDLGPASNESQKKLQLYHDFLVVLLQEVKYAATNKPVMMINLGRVWQKRRLHIHVSVVMGDQKLQDYICGRNSRKAGRVHHSCMTSSLQASNTVAGCCLANPDVISQLNKIAMIKLNKCVPGPAKTISDTLPRLTTLEKHEYKKALGFLNRRVKLARSILGRTYSMHPLRNAFDGVPFGANKHGILVATTEDHLHACESGILLNLAEVAYGGLTPAESKVFEQIIWSKVTTCQSSVLSELPCGTTKKNFGNLTLYIHKEMVSIIYYLLLALHDKGGHSIFEQAQTRQTIR
jgi:hypothetical protein